nr:MAG TPA: hypothetical protein [Caudoviricetes sp.]
MCHLSKPLFLRYWRPELAAPLPSRENFSRVH